MKTRTVDWYETKLVEIGAVNEDQEDDRAVAIVMKATVPMMGAVELGHQWRTRAEVDILIRQIENIRDALWPRLH